MSNTLTPNTPTPNTLRSRLVKGFAAQGFAQAISLIIQVVSVPLFVHYWGKFLYGEWLLISTVPAYFALSDLGFANAAGNEMTMRVGRGDRAGALVVFQSAWVLVTGLSAALTMLLLAAVQLLPIGHWLKLATLTHAEVTLVATLLILHFFFDLQASLLGISYRFDGHFAAGTMIRNTLRLMEFLAGAAVICLGGHMVALALVTIVVRMVGNLLTVLDIRRRSPWLVIGWRHADLVTLKWMLSPALTSMGFPLGTAFSLQGMVLVVGTLLGPVAVVVFSTSRTLSRFVWQLLTIITNTVWVELSTAFGAGDIALARRLHRRTCQAAIWISVPLCLALLASGGVIFRLWTHGKVPFDPILFGLLLLVVVCNSFWSASYITLMSVNRHQQLAFVYTFATGLSLVIGVVLTRLIGLHGAALALLVIDAFMSGYVITRSLRLVQDTLPAFLRSVMAPPSLNPSTSLAEAL